MNRDEMLDLLKARREPWDMVIIGGGATGAGIAVDAASRGYDVALLEAHDFGKGTSSRSTKLVHGGVRYLQQGNLPLVREALRERGLLLRNAPHLVHSQAFVVPTYSWWESPFYGLGLKVYDFLSGKYRLEPSRRLSRTETLERLPTLRPEGLRGGILYFDGQFDDARLLICLVATAADLGATVVNYCPVVGVLRNAGGTIAGVQARDGESAAEITIPARVVINATGVFCDGIRRMADPQSAPLVTPSQGIHLVLDRSFLPGSTALIVPRTRDGRVMFAIPWHDHTLLGTTDNAVEIATLEPTPTSAEIDFVLETAARYLHRPLARENIQSMFAGIRPLIRQGDRRPTSTLSRSHTIRVERGGLVTITGGKWTTYRNMAEDCVTQAAALAGLEQRPSRTPTLDLHGSHASADAFGSLRGYGSDAAAILALTGANPELAARLHPDLSAIAAEVVWAARSEMARTVEDVLARRTRSLVVNVRAALAAAPQVAALLAGELGRDASWQTQQVRSFEDLARGYLPPAQSG